MCVDFKTCSKTELIT